MTAPSLPADAFLRVAFGRATDASATLVGRLATGLRVRSAADDAAGTAVATDLRAREHSTDAALRNLDDGLSATRIADGGLSEIAGVLQRLRQLALAAANGVLDDEQRASIQAEVDQSLTEIDRIARATRFGERRLLAPYHVLVGILIDTSASMGGEVTALVQAMSDFQAQLEAQGVSVDFGLVEVDTAPSKDPVDGTAALAQFGASDVGDVLANTPLAFGPVDPYASIFEAVGETATAGAKEPDTLEWTTPADERHLVYVTDTGRETDLTSAPDAPADVAAALKERGIQATVVADAADFGTFSEITNATGGLLLDKGDDQGSGIASAFDTLAQTILAGVPSQSTIEIQAGIDGGEEDRISLDLPLDATSGALGLSGLSVATQAQARAALAPIDEAIDRISSARARVGAISNRIATTRSRQRGYRGELAAAEARIVDLDVARATADAARQRIVQEAAAGTLVRLRRLEAGYLATLLTSR